MHRNRFALLVVFALLAALAAAAQAQPSLPPGVAFDEKPGATVPLDIPFTDTRGRTVTLGALMDGKPVILCFVYYHCPGMCTPMLGNLADALGKVKLEPGRDFKVVTVSINHHEPWQTAAAKRKNVLHPLRRAISPDAWEFLTGTREQIRKLTDAAGFMYREEKSGLFTHPFGLVVLSPQGKITRYLIGVSWLPFDLEMAVTEASKGREGPTVRRAVAICYSYDPASRRYVLDVTRLAGVGTLALVALTLLVVFAVKRAAKGKPGTDG